MSKTALIILDGWGHGRKDDSNAIFKANTPFIDSLYQSYPNAELLTHGEHVGLPEGQMGNSEVGHMNIGGGRIIYQELLRINNAISDGTFNQNRILLHALEYAKVNNKSVHLMGLVSDGGVHSHINHVKALCSVIDQQELANVFIHAFTDGRDTDPKSGVGFIKELYNHIEGGNIKFATITGRYYAMDRDNRWDRIQLAYDAMVNGVGTKYTNPIEAIESSYKEEISDEFIKPIVLTDSADKPIGTISDDDVVICFNFRKDRCRQITQALTQADYPDHSMSKLPLTYLTMGKYDENFENVHVLFDDENVPVTLGEVLANAKKTQIRIAETEKYPHVTYFFSGGREKEFQEENRILIPSPKVPTYDEQPEMSAEHVAEAIIKAVNEKEVDFICLNFANSDMVGHTGDFDAAMKAVSTVDKQCKQVVETLIEHDYSILITADHGNADFMINDDGTPNTAHTKNLVPIFLVNGPKDAGIVNGKLGDIAPTILTLMKLDIPEEMTGKVLLT